MGAPLNLLDIAVISIVSLSALVAFFRGFIREILSLGAWVGAAIITIYLFPHTTEMMKHHVKSDNMAAGIGALGTYIAALIVISMLTSILMRYVKTGAEVGLLDNFLGLLFGLLRGAFIVSLGWLIAASFIPKDPSPEWVKTSFTKEYMQQGADALTKLAPEYLNELEGMVKKHTTPEKQENDTNPASQQQFNNLIDSTQPQGADFHRN